MPRLKDVITSPEMGSSPFIIHRYHYVTEEGEPVLDWIESIPTAGAVQPARDEDVSLLPEMYRTERVFAFYSPLRFSAGSREDGRCWTAPDRILWDSEQYLVVSVKDWKRFGFSRALAVLKSDICPKDPPPA